MTDRVPTYDPNPLHDVTGGTVAAGWDVPADGLDAGCVLALDGPAAMNWDAIVADVVAALRAPRVTAVDVREFWRPWADVLAATTSPTLADDPNFERLATGRLADLVVVPPPRAAEPDEIVVLFGPGAALLAHDVLWYLDRPKRLAEADVGAGRARNLGQRPGDGPATTKRLFYVDWPLLDRHRDHVLWAVDHWFDVQDPRRPTSLDGTALWRTLAALARHPMRTRPNTALGRELVAPESGLLVGDRRTQVELPFQLVVAAHPATVMGARVHDMFGTSFPVRFEYLDTVDGGNVPVRCHPRSAYMREVFGWPYTQHEAYYVVVGGPKNTVFLGLHGDVDLEEFQRAATRAHEDGVELDIERWVQTFPATEHQLFCIPAGTPHGSGEGNVVLEVSATPYRYSLPVHEAHAFANLDRSRTGAAVREELVCDPVVVRQRAGWREEVLCALPEMFYEVRRLVLEGDTPVPDDAIDGFHVLNVVSGAGVEISWAGGQRVLARAETIVVPAAVRGYRLRRLGVGPVRVVKALVR